MSKLPSTLDGKISCSVKALGGCVVAHLQGLIPTAALATSATYGVNPYGGPVIVRDETAYLAGLPSGLSARARRQLLRAYLRSK